MKKIPQDDKARKVRELESQIIDIVWIQVVAQIYEGILLTKLYNLNSESEGERTAVTGVWIQAIGSILEAISISKQVNEDKANITWKKLAVTGDSIQSFGSALEAFGGIKIIEEELTPYPVPFMIFDRLNNN